MHAHPFGKIKVNNASADQQVEREREMFVFFLNFVSLLFSGKSSTYFKVSCSSLQKVLFIRDV